MSPRDLPVHAEIVQLRRRAKELRAAAAAGDAQALARVAAIPELRANDGLVPTQAQLVIAREHGFPSAAKDWLGGTALHHGAMRGWVATTRALIAGRRRAG